MTLAASDVAFGMTDAHRRMSRTPVPSDPAGGAEASRPTRAPRAILIKYRSQGEYGLAACAERLSRRGADFATHLADGSPSLDGIRRRFGLGIHRAVFRRTTGASFEHERDALRERLRRARQRARPARRASALRSAEASLPDLAHVYRVRLPEGQSLDAVLAALRADPHVAYAQPDHLMTLDQALPSPPSLPFDDPFLSTQGSWGQPYADLWGLEQIGAPEAWAISRGDGVVVAVVDTGLDRFHPDIAENVWVNPGEDLDGDGRAEPEDENGIDDDGNGFVDDLTGFDFANSVDADEDGRFDGPEDVSDPDPFDDVGHGTHVAGTIAAVADNGIGIVGVAPGARIMSLKGFPADGPAEDSVLWRAVLYAAENGADVINNSWSCGIPCPSNPLAEDVLAHVDALGALVVTSAGNAEGDVLFRSPENGDRVVTVGALGFDERLPRFSNRGWGLDLVAPGGGPETPVSVRVARRNILSLLTSAIDPAEEIFAVGDDYWRLAGTSMAAPHVSGAAALLLSLRPELAPADLRRLLRIASRDLGLPGHDPLYGGGRLDLPRLLAAEPPDLDLAIELPAPGDRLDPRRSPIAILGRASGRDLDRVELAVAPGLTGRVFVPLADALPARRSGLSPSPTRARRAVGAASRGDRPKPRAPDPGDEPEWPAVSRDALLGVWDASDLPDGPWVIRLRGWLQDGRVVDELRVVSLERTAPERLSTDPLAVGRPAIDRREVVWPVAESETRGAPFDLAGTRLAPPRPAPGFAGRPGHAPDDSLAAGVQPTFMHPAGSGSDHDEDAGESEGPIEPLQRLLAAPGSQDEVEIDGRLVAWRTGLGPELEIGACWLEAARAVGRAPVSADPDAPPRGCRPIGIEPGPGLLSRPRVGRRRIVWQRDEAGARHIEGCRVDRRRATCSPVPLVDPAEAGAWTLRSFDGRTLLLQSGLSLALCALPQDDGFCTPEAIVFPPGTPPPAEPVHDGRLLAFNASTIGMLPAPGCLPGETIPECSPSFAVLLERRACWIEPETNTCDSIAVSARSRADYDAGLDVSGRRVVWSVGSELELPSVRSCELLSGLGECVEQRLSGSAARQDGPAIDGTRVVWRDARDGQDAIFLRRLPALRGPARVTLRAGRPFTIVLHAGAGDGGRLDYAVSAASSAALDPVEAGVRVRDPGAPGGWVLLRGAWPREAAGRHLWRIRATAPDGLFSDWLVEVEVEAKAEAKAKAEVAPGKAPRAGR